MTTRSRRLRPVLSARLAYTLLTIAGGSAIVAGVALVFPPLALILGGVGLAGLGLIGLAAGVRR